jgi:hypothetical protein
MSSVAGKREPLLSKQVVRLRDDMRRMRIRFVLRMSSVILSAENVIHGGSKTYPQQSLRPHYLCARMCL